MMEVSDRCWRYNAPYHFVVLSLVFGASTDQRGKIHRTRSLLRSLGSPQCPKAQQTASCKVSHMASTSIGGRVVIITTAVKGSCAQIAVGIRKVRRELVRAHFRVSGRGTVGQGHHVGENHGSQGRSAPKGVSSHDGYCTRRMRRAAMLPAVLHPGQDDFVCIIK